MVKRKGIEFQINWIFILIAGALIIAFFFGVVQKQKSISEKKLSIKISEHMDAVFSGAIESKGTAQPLAVPSQGIAFACTGACDCNWYIGKKANPYLDNLIFAPEMLKGADALALALEWKMPFRIANFLYLTNPNVKYYFVYEPAAKPSKNLFEDISNVVPAAMDYEAVLGQSHITNLQPEGFRHTQFVFFDIEPGILNTLGEDWKDESVSGVSIKQGNQLIFSEKDPKTGIFNEYPSLWAKEESMLAAVFAADHTMYDCNMKKAFAKLSVIAGVHSLRARELEKQVAKEECVYSPAAEMLDDTAESADELSKSLTETRPLRAIISAQELLDKQNEIILRAGCPVVY